MRLELLSTRYITTYHTLVTLESRKLDIVWLCQCSPPSCRLSLLLLSIHAMKPNQCHVLTSMLLMALLSSSNHVSSSGTASIPAPATMAADINPTASSDTTAAPLDATTAPSDTTATQTAQPAQSDEKTSHSSLLMTRACQSLLLSMLHYVLVLAEKGPGSWLLANVTSILEVGGATLLLRTT